MKDTAALCGEPPAGQRAERRGLDPARLPWHRADRARLSIEPSGARRGIEPSGAPDPPDAGKRQLPAFLVIYLE